MQLTLCGQTALAFLRQERRRRGSLGLVLPETRLLDPNPSPRAHWTKKVFEGLFSDMGLEFDPSRKIHICVSESSRRLKSQYVENTVYGTQMPQGSFVLLRDEIAISSPGLLFIELAGELDEGACARLVSELTDELAVTSVGELRAYLDIAPKLETLPQARSVLDALTS